MTPLEKAVVVSVLLVIGLISTVGRPVVVQWMAGWFAMPTATVTPKPTLTPGSCVELDVKTFAVDDTVDKKIIGANTTYSATLANGAGPELIITANIIPRPPGCLPQLAIRWTRHDNTDDVPLDKFQDSLIIAHPAPPAGKGEMISVFIQDKVTRAEVSAYLILRSMSQEESKGASK